MPAKRRSLSGQVTLPLRLWPLSQPLVERSLHRSWRSRRHIQPAHGAPSLGPLPQWLEKAAHSPDSRGASSSSLQAAGVACKDVGDQCPVPRANAPAFVRPELFGSVGRLRQRLLCVAADRLPAPPAAFVQSNEHSMCSCVAPLRGMLPDVAPPFTPFGVVLRPSSTVTARPGVRVAAGGHCLFSAARRPSPPTRLPRVAVLSARSSLPVTSRLP
mmetsp:Transcript_35657/g.88713  ORF Transcript_35657/g.88713 Transcript_35657/m.88713 type:complete len:215 (-) Transcript_35657:211-855(-)